LSPLPKFPMHCNAFVTQFSFSSFMKFIASHVIHIITIVTKTMFSKHPKYSLLRFPIPHNIQNPSKQKNALTGVYELCEKIRLFFFQFFCYVTHHMSRVFFAYFFPFFYIFIFYSLAFFTLPFILSAFFTLFLSFFIFFCYLESGKVFSKVWVSHNRFFSPSGASTECAERSENEGYFLHAYKYTKIFPCEVKIC